MSIRNNCINWLCALTIMVAMVTMMFYFEIWPSNLDTFKINNMIYDPYDVTESKKKKLYITFIHSVTKMPGGGPLAAQKSVIDALISYSKDPINLCQSISSLSLLNNTKPIYFDDYQQNINHALIRTMFDLNIEFKYDAKFDNKLPKKDIIFMTAIQSGRSRNFFTKTYPKINRKSKRNTIFIMGPNVAPKDLINFRSERNEYFIECVKEKVDMFRNDGKLKSASSSFIGYIPTPLNNELTNIALHYVSNETLWNSYQLRTKCIAYIKKDPPFSSYTIAMGHKYNCIIFKYGEYNRSYFIEIAKQSSFAIISDIAETQGYAFMELMAHNVPLFIVEWREQWYINHNNDSRIFHNFDNSLCGHVCVFDSDHLSKPESILALNHCFENIFLKNIKNGLYKPSMFVLKEFNQCDYVESLLDMTLPFIYNME